MQKYLMEKMLTNAFQHNLTPKGPPFQPVIEQNPYNLVSESIIQYWITWDCITLP